VLIIVGHGPPETIRWLYCGGRLTALACAPVLTAPKGRSAPVLGQHRQSTHRSEPSNGLLVAQQRRVSWVSILAASSG